MCEQLKVNVRLEHLLNEVKENWISAFKEVNDWDLNIHLRDAFKPIIIIFNNIFSFSCPVRAE